MADLWAARREMAAKAVEPLAVRMRPETLEQFTGQRHILGEGKLLRRMLQADTFTSLLLFGPPGTGKTTLARVIANHTRRHFEHENASSVGVKRIRQIIDEALARLEQSGRRTILFLDEIHRFNKAQQDVLLGDVERGVVTLIGATTENPLFACNSALVSRSTLFRLEPLRIEEVIQVLRRAIADADRGYGSLDLRVSDEALRVWAVKCDGDARRALTALETAVLSTSPPHLATTTEDESGSVIVIDRATAEESIQQKTPVYDGTGDEHYDTISAMIKSIRGSDPDAAVYWIARMLEAGEDPRFIARRLAILASEDIGNADPRAIMVAAACWELVERVGMPECRINLSQTAIYLALAPKSNASCAAIDKAMEDVREGRTVPVPVELRDSHALPSADGTPHGQGYVYSHDEPDAVGTQDYLGVDAIYYTPTDRGAEKILGQRLQQIRQRRKRGRD
jgi:putative ATPase